MPPAGCQFRPSSAGSTWCGQPYLLRFRAVRLSLRMTPRRPPGRNAALRRAGRPRRRALVARTRRSCHACYPRPPGLIAGRHPPVASRARLRKIPPWRTAPNATINAGDLVEFRLTCAACKVVSVINVVTWEPSQEAGAIVCPHCRKPWGPYGDQVQALIKALRDVGHSSAEPPVAVQAEIVESES